MSAQTFTTGATARITCDCDTCKANAAKVGAAFPLAADWTPKADKAAATLAKTAKARHSLVTMAHSPLMVEQVAARAVGVVAVR